MKATSTIFLTAICLVPAIATAQSGLTPTSSNQIYGRVDISANLQKRSGVSGTSTAVASDVSFIGFRGTEDLGGGSKAYFKMEHGFDASSGAPGSATQFWNREIYVGLRNEAVGAVQLGTAWSPAIWLTGRLDPFGRSQLGASQSIFQGTGTRGYAAQFANSVQYLSPLFSNVQARLYAALGEGTPAKGTGVALDYLGKALYLGLAYDRVGTTGASVGLPTVPVATASTLGVGGSYIWPLVKVSAYVQTNRTEGLRDTNGYALGATVPAGTGEFRMSYSSIGSGAGKATLTAIGYHHALSKRTAIYASAAKLDNGAATRFSLAPSAPDFSRTPISLGQDATGLGVGIRHTF